MEVMRIQTTVRRAQFHDMTLGGQIYPGSYHRSQTAPLIYQHQPQEDQYLSLSAS